MEQGLRTGHDVVAAPYEYTYLDWAEANGAPFRDLRHRRDRLAPGERDFHALRRRLDDHLPLLADTGANYHQAGG